MINPQIFSFQGGRISFLLLIARYILLVTRYFFLVARY